MARVTRASRWHVITYPCVSAVPYLRAYQNSKCVPPVLIHRAITCDSFKKPRRSCVTIKKKKKDPKSYFLNCGDPRHAPGVKCLHHCILLFITFDLICNMTMFVQNRFWTLRGHPPWPCPQGLHQNSECVSPVFIHRAIACESFEILA